MREDPIMTLERELVEAARRRAATAPKARRPRFESLVAALLVTVTVLVAGGTLILLGGHRRSTPTASVSGRKQLTDILGVLRRPQTAADLPAWLRRQLTIGPMPVLHGQPDFSLVRLAATTPWGEHLYLVPMRPPTAAVLNALVRRFPGAALLIAHSRHPGETLSVESRGVVSGAGTAAMIEAGGDQGIEGAGRAFAGGSTKTRFIVVVPDGVARVEFLLPRQPYLSHPGAPIHARDLRVTVPVTGNIAATQVNRPWNGRPVAMIWLAANGSVIKRIGDAAFASRRP